MFRILRSLLFLIPAEGAHSLTMKSLIAIRGLGLMPLLQMALKSKVAEKPVELMGLQFRNRMGLAAGFDKNAEYLEVIDSLGFGFVEVGTVTPVSQSGNPKPRLFRLPKDHALINRMGFNNEGVDVMVKRLKRFREKHQNSTLIIGGNIGKNKITPNENAADDYRICFEKLHPWVDFFVVNVSSPNTPNLRDLQDKEPLRKIFKALQTSRESMDASISPKPVLIKISPDNADQTVDDILGIVQEFNLAGVVSSNTTVSRSDLLTKPEHVAELGDGGLSGRPLKVRATELISYLRERNKDMVVIGVGGVESAADAAEKSNAGADLIQVYTGFIYAGPRLIAEGVEILD